MGADETLCPEPHSTIQVSQCLLAFGAMAGAVTCLQSLTPYTSHQHACWPWPAPPPPGVIGRRAFIHSADTD